MNNEGESSDTNPNKNFYINLTKKIILISIVICLVKYKLL